MALWTLARRQRAVGCALHRIQSKRLLQRRNQSVIMVLVRCLPTEDSMRWKFGPSGHDPRQIDLLAAIALVVFIVAVDYYFTEKPTPHQTSAFIEPSQSVRW
jgi:hypothetical protein